MASEASKLLRSLKASKTVKSVAGAALAGAQPKKSKKRPCEVRRLTEDFTIEYQGKSYPGHRVIKDGKIDGNLRLFQTIYYRSKSKATGAPIDQGTTRTCG